MFFFIELVWLIALKLRMNNDRNLSKGDIRYSLLR